MTQLVRTTLWIGAPMNLLVSRAPAQPASLPGRIVGAATADLAQAALWAHRQWTSSPETAA